MRDRLIEMIQESVDGCARHWAEVVADHLLANGVVIIDPQKYPALMSSGFLTREEAEKALAEREGKKG